MAAIATALAGGPTDLRSACRSHGPSTNIRRSRPQRYATAVAVDVYSGGPTPLHRRLRSSVHVLASNPKRQFDSSDDASSFMEDLSYLGKLGAGSFAGAAAIKYGSIIFPDITRPNILQALIMISTPVIIAVFLLFKQGREAE